jgi:YD repeat-containing protein
MGLLSTVGTVAGTYFGGPAGGAIGGALGGAIEGGQGIDAANRQYGDAARMSQFRPVGITSNFGTSNFGYDENGRLTSAGYTLDPRLQGAQDTLMGGLGQNTADISNIQNMGRQYLAQSPQEAAQQWMQSQQALLQPARDQQWSNLGTQNFNQGTTGLSVAQGGSLASANPYASALANAQSQQDLALAARAQQAGQEQYKFGQGLLSSAYDPYNASLKSIGATEALGQDPLKLGLDVGGRSTAGSTNAADWLAKQDSQNPWMSGTNQFFNNPAVMSGIKNWMSQPSSSDWGNYRYEF